MVKQGQGIECVLPMIHGLLRIAGAAVTAGIRRDELVRAQKTIATGVDPIMMTAPPAV
jgi:hypothetical protein